MSIKNFEMRECNAGKPTLFLVLLLLWSGVTFAQANPWASFEPLPQDSGAAGLKQMLIRLHTTARLMHITAHPDDEDGGMLVLESRGKGVNTLLLTLNRGEGGQNKLGSNLFDELGVLRTLELLASDQYYAVEQRFTRVADFGFSKTAAETFAKWGGHDAALADMVQVIRTFRPDVLVSRFQGSPIDGHGHHQAAGILAREAFRAAGDPTRFPEQIRAGLEPWQPKKLYVDNVRPPQEYTVALDTGTESPLLGTSYVQFAMQGLRHQRSQGAASWNVAPGPHPTFYKLIDSVTPHKADLKEQDFFDGINTTIPGLASRIEARGAKVSAFLHPALAKIAADVEQATTAAEHQPSSAAAALLDGSENVNNLLEQVNKSSLPAAVKADLLTELRTKRTQFEQAAQLALGLDLRATVDASANGALVVPGQTFNVTAELHNGGDQTVELRQVELDLPLRWHASGRFEAQEVKPGESAAAKFSVTVPADGELTRPNWHRSDPESQTVYTVDNEREATLPLPSPPAQAHAIYAIAGKRADIHTVVRGMEKKSPPLAVVPPFSVLVDPATQVLPTSTKSGAQVKIDVRNYLPGKAEVTVRAPASWSAQPRSETWEPARIDDDKQITFKLEPQQPFVEARYPVHAVLKHGGHEYTQGFSIVTRDDLGTFYYYQPAIQQVSAVNVKLPNDLAIGYLMGAGDEIPAVLKQLGLNVAPIAADELAHGDLSRFGTIVLGIRAYDTRSDVRENNQRLLDYVNQGGTLIVQYNSGLAEFNKGHFTPYPAELSRDRVSVEQAPVTVLAPKDPIFNFPNLISPHDFDGWVQERGLYFMDQWDPHFEPLMLCGDPGEPPREGGLLRAHYGKGVYIYTGYAFFRQLPTGVPGAIRLFVNLVSAGHEPQ